MPPHRAQGFEHVRCKTSDGCWNCPKTRDDLGASRAGRLPQGPFGDIQLRLARHDLLNPLPVRRKRPWTGRPRLKGPERALMLGLPPVRRS